MTNRPETGIQSVRIEPNGLQGLLGMCEAAKGLIVFAHASGSGRLNSRNNHVAARLQQAGCATLLLDLLRSDEEAKRANVFNIPLLASRLLDAAKWTMQREEISHLPLGYFGAKTGAAAALVAAANKEVDVAAVVCCSGRADLAAASLAEVFAPTLLIVGDREIDILDLNRHAYDKIPGRKELVVALDAGYVFDEPHTLEQVITWTTDWFTRHFAPLRQAQLPDTGPS